MEPADSLSTPFTRTSEHFTREVSAPNRPPAGDDRPCVRGKFLYVGDEKFYVRGATYGTFCPRDDDCEYPEPEVVRRDFASMAANGLNAVRTYTAPPRWLLDAAHAEGLRVMVGLPVERYIGFLSDGRKKAEPDASTVVREGVRGCAGHPAVLCYVVGNEIPASIARWHDHARVTRFIERLYRVAKSEDPGGLVTYVNYPSTEYLELPFLDFVCFNVFLESEPSYRSYLARLQNFAGERPLVMTEVGLDSLRNGEEVQARTLQWQVRAAFEAGCAGVFVYSWTDEWYRGEAEVYDWAFGLTRRDRRPKPALEAVRAAFRDTPLADGIEWPCVSVVICTYNGSRTIRESLEALRRLDYPDYEVIVVDDGSSDRTAEVVSEFECVLIRTENHGLSHARNRGLAAASGEIVAYIDDDAYPDPHWLKYLATTFMNTNHAGVGGPNIAPPGDGLLAECIANAPGNPIHVLLSDEVAEHIPGCNMAFRKSCLEAVGGFDPQFRVAGDDIDVCWKLQQAGWTLGFNPSAMVWHHRRGSLRAYWRQQRGYGRAEALVERKWPEKYGDAGQITWGGRLYGRGLARALGWRRHRIYHGIWGSAAFQSLYEPAPGQLGWLVRMPEWYLLTGALAVLSLLGWSWPPLKLALFPFALAAFATLGQAALSGAKADFRNTPNGRLLRLRLHFVTFALHVLHPLARLSSRVTSGLTPWRRLAPSRPVWPGPTVRAVWSEQWQAAEERLAEIAAALRRDGICVRAGGAFDRWDLEVRGGTLGGARLLMAVEEHGGGKQLVRIRTWPKPSFAGALVPVLLGTLAMAALGDGAWVAGFVLGTAGVIAAVRTLLDVAAASGALRRVLD